MGWTIPIAHGRARQCALGFMLTCFANSPMTSSLSGSPQNITEFMDDICTQAKPVELTRPQQPANHLNLLVRACS